MTLSEQYTALHPKVDLKPFQVEARDYLLEAPVRLLALPPRGGKTYASVAAIDILYHDFPGEILIICPAFVRSNWRNKIAELSSSKCTFTVVSYDSISGGSAPRPKGKKWSLIILDEVHRLSVRTSKRTKAIFGDKCDGKGLIRHAQCVWGLSGTLARKDPVGLWAILHAMLPSAITFDGRVLPYFRFQERYCVTLDTGFGRKVVGSKRLTELRDRMAPHIFIRDKKDIGLGTAEPQFIDLIPSRTALRALKEFEDSVEGRKLRRAFEIGGVDAMAKIASGNTMRRLAGLAKVEAVAALIDQEIEDGLEKIVLGCYHRDVITELSRALGAHHPLIFIGGMKSSDQDATIRKFKTEKKHVVLIGQLMAMGEGIDVSVSDELLFVERSTVPAENTQFAARIENIEKGEPGRVRIATIPGTLDKDATYSLANRQKTLDKLFV